MPAVEFSRRGDRNGRSLVDADVLPFPSTAMHCSDCENALVGLKGIYCMYWHEEVQDTTATECQEYDPW